MAAAPGGRGFSDDGAIRVFVIDDHAVVLAGLRQVVSAAQQVTLVGEASVASGTPERILAARPHVVIADVRLPDGDGIDLARRVRSIEPHIQFIMFTAFADERAFLDAVLAGAAGYLAKDADPDDVVDAVRRVAAGGSLFDAQLLAELRRQPPHVGRLEGAVAALSPHERRILDLVAMGLTNREIATKLGLAEKTIRNYVSGILGKVGVRNRTQLAVYVAQLVRTSQD